MMKNQLINTFAIFAGALLIVINGWGGTGEPLAAAGLQDQASSQENSGEETRQSGEAAQDESAEGSSTQEDVSAADDAASQSGDAENVAPTQETENAGSESGTVAGEDTEPGAEAGTGEDGAATESEADIVYGDLVEYPAGDYWFPLAASDFAAEVDWLFYFIYYVSIFFFVVIVGVMVAFVIKYRKRPGHEKALPAPSHNTALEILWSVLPSTLLVFMFVAGASGYFKQRVIPDGAYEIDVEASQYNWVFTYENGEQTEDLHLVVNEPVKLRMYSKDVIHSFFVPAFRQKMDVVPGRYSELWFKPTQAPDAPFRLYCTEYCGDGHSLMKKAVIIHKTKEDFEAAVKFPWDVNVANGEEWRNGERLWALNCKGCHSNDGTAMTGPSFLNKYGSQEQLMGGDTQVVDDAYIMESIYQPQKDIVEGYGPRSQMPSFDGKLSDQQVGWIIEYMKTLKQ